VDRTTAHDTAVTLNFAADRLGDVVWSDVFNVHVNLSSERDETRCGVEVGVGVGVEVGVEVGIGIGIEVGIGATSLARSGAGEAAEIFEPP
jgi:hypothetical protein